MPLRDGADATRSALDLPVICPGSKSSPAGPPILIHASEDAEGNVAVITRVVHALLELAEQHGFALDLGELTAATKAKCVELRVDYSGPVVHRAIDFSRRRATPAIATAGSFE